MADSAAASRLPVSSPPAPDWTVQAADSIERVVTTVRTNTADRLVSVARLLVYGLLAAVMGLMALVLFVILVTRVLDVYVANIFGDGQYARAVWVVDVAIGGLFLLAGLFLWSKRTARNRG
jgi:hypothetical protein